MNVVTYKMIYNKLYTNINILCRLIAIYQSTIRIYFVFNALISLFPLQNHWMQFNAHSISHENIVLSEDSLTIA